jgi:hypothetical protein
LKLEGHLVRFVGDGAHASVTGMCDKSNGSVMDGWSRGDKITLVSVLVAIVGVVAALVVVPDLARRGEQWVTTILRH